MRKIFSILFVCFVTSSYAQRYNFINYNVEEGLAQSQINDIQQDELGYLWIGTESGLSKFNGLTFDNFSLTNGLPDNKIEKIYVDESNNIWVGTPNGIGQYNGRNKFKPYFFEEPQRINDISSFRDQIYIATNNGLYKKENDLLVKVSSNLEDELYIRALLNDNDNFLICGARTGLYTYKTEFELYYDSTFSDYNISDLEMVNNYLIISTYRDGMLRFDTEEKILMQYELATDRIRSIYADSTVILCSTVDGLIEVGSQVSYFGEKNGLISEDIVCAYKDKEGNYWLGTDGYGILKFLGKSVISFSTNEGLSSNIVMSIDQLSDSTFVFGTYSEGITTLSMDGELSYINNLSGLDYNTVWSILSDDERRYWVGSSAGAYCMKDGKEILPETTDQINTKIRSITRMGDIYFFGGTEGLYVMSEGQVLYLDHTHDMNINDLCVVKDNLYVGSRNGLYILKKSNNFSSSELVDLPESNINSITKDKRDYVWVGTENGLYVILSDEMIVPFDLDKNDFKSKTVLGVIESSNHDIWVATMSGVYQIDHYGEKPMDFVINHFSTAQGLINLETNLNAIYEDHDHKIWVGTAGGLVRIDPDLNEELFDFKVPELHLTGIRLFMEDFDYDRFDAEYASDATVPKSLSLPYNQNHLTFDFIGINLKNPESVSFQYRLKGSNETWSPLTNAQYATYSDVPPGDYTFEVRATNKSMGWSEISSVEITIRPPYWKTWWFIILMIALGFTILAAIFQVRIRAIKQKQENERLGFRNRLLFLEQQSLNASMNRHFIFNSLNSIQYFINSSDKLSANKYLSSFAKLIRKNLDSSTSNNFIVTLQEEIERIELYLTLEKMRFQEKFDYELNVSSSIDTEGTEIPSMILQPFVENSIIHGVLPLARKGMIKINIFEEYDDVIFEVIDDGIGIDNTLKNKKQSISGDHESKGMDITNRRIELLRKLTGENLLIIGPFQLNNEEGECIGTKVIIKMGLNREQ